MTPRWKQRLKTLPPRDGYIDINTILVEFQDGLQVFTSRYAVRMVR